MDFHLWVSSTKMQYETSGCKKYSVIWDKSARDDFPLPLRPRIIWTADFDLECQDSRVYRISTDGSASEWQSNTHCPCSHPYRPAQKIRDHFVASHLHPRRSNGLLICIQSHLDLRIDSEVHLIERRDWFPNCLWPNASLAYSLDLCCQLISSGHTENPSIL